MPSTVTRIGFDEAGLGPTLGPLVVAGFATQRRGDVGGFEPVDDLWRLLDDVIGSPGVRDGRIEVGDSKQIHAGAHKLRRIERSALAGVAWAHGCIPRHVGELLELVGVRAFERTDDRHAPWWSMLDEALPIASPRSDIEADAERLRAAAKRAKLAAPWYAADVIDPARVNRELAAEDRRAGGSKNTWATHAVLRLVALASEQLAAPRLSIWCDKAGGRQAYREPIERAFPQTPLFGASTLACVAEQRERSIYHLRLGKRELGLGFVMRGDSLDPRIAWASILAKYLRELMLRAFNRYFAMRIEALRPTAGYPEDARRFIAEVEAALGPDGNLPRQLWIRCK